MGSYDRERVERLLRERSEELRRSRPQPEEEDLADAEVDAGRERLLDDEEQRILQARRALEEGTYGTCADCGGQIPPQRLDAVPEAVRCIDCQRRYEG